MPKKLNEKQKKLVEDLQDSMTRSEFEAFVTTVAQKVKSINDRNVKDFESIISAVNKKLNMLTTENGNNFGSLKSSTEESINSKLEALKKDVQAKLESVRDGIDGLDADEDIIVDKVLKKIVFPEIPNIKEDMPKMGEPIRDSLELLQDDEKLTVKAIGGLEKLIKKLIDEYDRGRPLGGGITAFNPDSFNIHVIEDQTPSGTVNGTNKAFTLGNTPSPASSLRVYVNGQRMTITEDYTLSGTTITFVTAPPTGSIIRVDYRV